MVTAGAAVEQQQRRHLAHRGAVGPKLWTLDVVEELNVAHLYTHAVKLREYLSVGQQSPFCAALRFVKIDRNAISNGENAAAD